MGKEFVVANPNIDAGIKAKIKMVSVKLRENANWICAKRQSVDFSPKDFEKVNAFLAAERVAQSSPLSKFVKSQQFEKMVAVKLADDANRNGKEKEMQSGGGDKKKKIMQKKKKQNRKKKSKMEKQNAIKKRINDDKIAEELRKNYQNKIGDQNVVISGTGDVV